MQTLCCSIGGWHAVARVEEMLADRLMAVISVTRSKDAGAGASRHTVVFEQREGVSALQETEIMVRCLLQARYSG